MTRSRPRSIVAYAVCVAIVIGIGLAVRSPRLVSPGPFAKYAGDALWAMMVFLLLALLLRRLSTILLGGIATAVCVAVEMSQLYHAPWINALRRSTLGALVLGDTFHWADIAAYLAGIATAMALEWIVRARRGPISESPIP